MKQSQHPPSDYEKYLISQYFTLDKQTEEELRENEKKLRKEYQTTIQEESFRPDGYYVHWSKNLNSNCESNEASLNENCCCRCNKQSEQYVIQKCLHIICVDCYVQITSTITPYLHFCHQCPVCYTWYDTTNSAILCPKNISYDECVKYYNTTMNYF